MRLRVAVGNDIFVAIPVVMDSMTVFEIRYLFGQDNPIITKSGYWSINRTSFFLLLPSVSIVFQPPASDEPGLRFFREVFWRGTARRSSNIRLNLLDFVRHT